MAGPKSPFSESLHSQKYRIHGESYREAMNRIASALTNKEEDYHEFRSILSDQRFLPAGRIQAAIGSTKRVTPYNCFVSGTIEDSFVDGHGSIMDRAKQAAATMRMGGGIGYDFSTLRPNGAMIKKLQSYSSGPISFMSIYDAVCKCISSAGARRGAQMGVLRVDHPDIEEFIHAKQNTDALTGFNISIAVTDEFMDCVEHGRPFNLRFGNEVYKEIDAQALWEKIMRSTWDWAEPGVLFIDQINRENNLRYCETITATNPCGEQPLPPYGACLLGSFNLVKYVKSPRLIMLGEDPVGGYFDFDQFTSDIRNVVIAMDNVVDQAVYPIYEQEKEAKNKRRMGLGVTGLANALEALGMPYGTEKFVLAEERILEALTNEAYYTSARLAQTHGAFPLFNKKKYLNSEFIKRQVDPGVIDEIKKYGIRNSHLTSIAPTGTISLTADNVSSGIEPVFSYNTERTYIGPEGPEKVNLQDYGAAYLNVQGKRCDEVTIEEHLNVLISATKRVDSAVSKTCNVPSDTPWQAFKDIYFKAWKNGAKGCTTYRAGGKREGIMKSIDQEAKACYIDKETGRRECE